MLTLLLAACGSGEAAAPESASTVGGVGDLPSELPPLEAEPTTVPDTSEPTESTEEPPPDTTTPSSDPATDREGERVLPVGRLVHGNRVLVIGDSIIASISNRYGGQLCDRLVPRGWEVEVNAEAGQHIEYGRQVLRRRLDAGWDAAVVMLGSNYGEDPEFYEAELDRLLGDLAPMPVVLVSVTEFKRDRLEVNYLIAVADNERDNVRVVDWGARTRDAEELLGDDGLHLSELGREELARMIATALGRAPARSDGRCLPTR
jgi:lysophospholipase L1-like esterase